MGKWTKKQKALCVVVIALLAVFVFAPRKYLVNRFEEAVVYQNGNPDYGETTQIHLVGTYYRNPLGMDQFVGEIKLDMFDATKAGSSSVRAEFLQGRAPIAYHIRDEEGNFMGQIFAGYLMCDPKMEDFCVLLSPELSERTADEEGQMWSSNDTLFVTSKSESREASLQVAKGFWSRCKGFKGSVLE